MHGVVLQAAGPPEMSGQTDRMRKERRLVEQEDLAEHER